MIRALFYLIVFVAGLGAALAWFGEIRHLRMAFGDDLPQWTQAINDDAGMRQGSAGIAVPGQPEILLRWRAVAPDLDGLHWELKLSGDAIEARAELLLPWWPQDAVLRNGRGSASDGVNGVLRLSNIEGKLPVLNRKSRGPGQITVTFDPESGVPKGFGPLGVVNGNTLTVQVPAP
ncbi:hypothetical protein AIOL_004419 [Candidatus Rhodobacter oscarellae]|uniref:General secretion pathway protein N n=1 Tax=Candidatus Rhodobacter oscarellae TaxID=1675527 RepID=A0A0J9E9G6_9RHOB|nr:hypothetical protein [Candidatus Rhodobacter lobularis]KMW59437.1 hypothetical protein AIOL_004419 [Candidatus Rhodobacter lobularis]